MLLAAWSASATRCRGTEAAAHFSSQRFISSPHASPALEGWENGSTITLDARHATLTVPPFMAQTQNHVRAWSCRCSQDIKFRTNQLFSFNHVNTLQLRQ